MLHVRDVTKWYGDVKVLDRVSLDLNRGERAGLIGPNGCGKTTLLKIIVGSLAPDRGHVSLSPAGVRVGYLPQALEFGPDDTVGDVLRAAGDERLAAETRLALLAEAITAAEGEQLAAAMGEYDRALAEFAALGGGQLESDADAVLAGLDMADVAQDRRVATLSGGQKTRLGLARLLLSRPDLLLLDEPTNHLDIVALEWLESFVNGYKGAVLIVSHDRAFLDATVERVFVLDNVTHRLREFAGNYSDYAVTLDRELDKQWATYREQQERVARLERSIRRLSSQSSRIEGETIHFHWRRIAKDLARRAVVQKARLQRVLDDEDMVDKPGLTWKMKLEFADSPRSGQDVLLVNDLCLGYGSRELFHNVNLHVGYGERVALIGPNGIGKTTLLRCIAGEVAPQTGAIRLGYGVKLGYMRQELEMLDQAATPFALIRNNALLDETETRSFLHYFLFAGDEVFVPIGKLSHGERSRLALALLAVQGCNFLLLDEPLNHLDIPSRERFERAVARFNGAVLAVVHDRYFIERFASTIWTVEDRSIHAVTAGGQTVA
jgi:ATP-binding cassette subfamily F protein 3